MLCGISIWTLCQIEINLKTMYWRTVSQFNLPDTSLSAAEEFKHSNRYTAPASEIIYRIPGVN